MQQKQPDRANSPRTYRKTKTPDQQFGEHVAFMRDARGMTQRELAAALTKSGVAVDASAVSRIEKGARSLRLWEALTVADVLGVSLQFLLGGTLTPIQEFSAKRNDVNEQLSSTRQGLLGLVAALEELYILVEEEPEVLSQLPQEIAGRGVTDVESYFAVLAERVEKQLEPEHFAMTVERKNAIQAILEGSARSVLGVVSDIEDVPGEPVTTTLPAEVS